MREKRKTGIDSIGDIPWGIHLCQFYNTKKDLIDILVPYFKAGLKNNEFCLWVTSEPLTEKEAKKTIKRAVPDLEQYLKRGQIEIIPHTEWYLKDGAFNLQRVLNAWFNKLNQALAKGYDGMRVTGNIAWLERRGWKDFDRYEEELNNAIGKYRMIALCTYPLDKYEAHEVIDVVTNHESALIRRDRGWELIVSCERKKVEKTLRETSDYLENLLNYANAPIIVWEPSFRIIRFNHAFEHLTGYTDDEVIDKGLIMLFPEASREESLRKIKRTSSGEYWEAVEIPILRKDGGVRIALWNSANIYTQDGKTLLATIAQGQDITERKEVEKMLQYQRDALSTHTRILSAILRTRDMDKLLNTILEEVMFFLQVEFGCIHLVQGDDLVLCCWKGFSDTSCAHLLSFSAENPPDWMRKLLFTKEQLSEHGIMPSFAKREGIQSWTCIPLELPPLREGETTTKWLGTLILCSRGVNALDKERIETLEIISHKIALAIDRAQSYRDAQERLFRLQALRDIDKAIIKQLDLKEVMHIVLDRIPEELGANAAAVSFLDEKQKITKIFAMRLPNGTMIEEEVFTLAESLLHWFVDKKEPVIIYNLLQDPRVQMKRNHLRNAGIVSYLGVPLIAQDKTIGVLHILTTKPMVFRDEDVEFFRTLAGQTAIALENARVTEALRESEEKYRTIFETTGTATAMVEEDTTISLVNTEFEKLSGYSKEEIEGKKSLTEFVVKEDLQRIKKYHIQRRVDPDAAPRNYEFKFIDRQGNVKDILVSVDIIPGTKKSVASLLDITERKRTEEVIVRLARQNKLILDSAGEGIIGLDLAGKQTFVNPSAVKMLGYEVEELIGKHSHSLWHHSKADGSLYPEEKCPIYAAFKNGAVYYRVRDEVFWRKDGTSFPVAYTSTPILEDDKIVGAVITFIDITERKLSEEALRESEEKYRTLFEDSKDVVYISTIEGKFLDINSAGVELFGYDSKEELLRIDIAKDLYLNPYDRKKFIQTMEQQGFVKDYELLLKRRDGEILTLLSTATPYRDKEGKIAEYRGILRDVTQQKKLEQQLLQAQKMEAVGQLAGGVAHDFNNILQAIIGYGSLLQMKMSKDNTLRHNVDQILASTERAANLTQSLLAFSRKHVIDLKPVKLNETIKRVEKLLSRLISEDIELRIILYPTTPPHPPLTKGGQEGIEDLTVMADSGQIEQVLMNLATNARDAMPDGGMLTISTEPVELDEEYLKTHGYGKPGMYALISVTDTGEGMDEKTREKIFDPFFTTKEVGKGTGLGLSMVYGIIKQHNGYINVYSEFGKGTTFKIYLPLTPAEVEERKPTKPTITIGGTETILLAEDDADVRTFTKSVLEEFGYTVIEAGNGEDAVKRFIENKDKVQLLLLDVIMPKKNGKEVYEEIRKTRPEIKALFMSGYAANIIQKKGILEKGLNFILKPISPTKLLRKVREVLDNK